MTDVEERAIATLKEILTEWQDIENKYRLGRDEALKKLDGYLDPSFYDSNRASPLHEDEWPLIGMIDDLVEIDQIEELSDGRISVTYTVKPFSEPWHRAMFVKQDDGRLLLQSGMMRCDVCFGDGVDDDGEECPFCNGEGWAH